MDEQQHTGWLRCLLCGALIGVGTILPGVSGGVLAVIFGIYRPMMEVLTNPLRAIPKHWRWLVPLGIGGVVGFALLAKLLSAALTGSPVVTTWLFVGLIAGTLPALSREAGKQGNRSLDWLWTLLCGAVMLAGLFWVSRLSPYAVAPSGGWFAFCGFLMGLGVVIPGMTASPIMMALGLYQPVLNGLVGADLRVLMTVVPSVGITVLLMARLATWIFRRFYSPAFHGILGIIVASTAAIIPLHYSGFGEVLASVVSCAAGFLLAWGMSILDGKLDRNA